MVWCYLSSDCHTITFRPADEVNATGCGYVADMQTRLYVRGQQNIAGNDRLLGDRRPAGESENSGARRMSKGSETQ